MAPLLAETLKPPRNATDPPFALAAFVSPARSRTYPPSPASLDPTVAAIVPAVPSAAGDPVAMNTAPELPSVPSPVRMEMLPLTPDSPALDGVEWVDAPVLSDVVISDNRRRITYLHYGRERPAS